MIFGFNTDVNGKDAHYHVQTEDRGAKNPLVESIVYVGGKIVDRRRTNYLPAELSQPQIEELVRKQHKELVDSIRSGSFVPSGNASAANSHSAPHGYQFQLKNPTDLLQDDQLQFEISVWDRQQQAAAKNVSIEVRWVLGGAVARELTVQPVADGTAVVSFPVPGSSVEAVLLLRAEGSAGRQFAKFLVHPPSEPRLP